jgi:LysM repeat protein
MIGPYMGSRRPARWLAPLALLASVVAVLAVISANRSSSRDTSTTTSQSTPAGTQTSPTRTTTTAKQRAPTGRGRSTYRVQSGDTLLRVAERTGVPVERIRELNPTVDANALRVGQVLRLRPAGQ